MKTKLLSLFSALLLLSEIMQAQCTGCTNTITTNTSTGIIVNSGQTLCIAPSVIMNGGITINSGGKVCNQGTIDTNVVIWAGGILENYGNMDSSKITNYGVFNNYGSIMGPLDTASGISNFNIMNNYGVITLDSSGISNMDTLNNFGTMNLLRLGTTLDGYLNNTSTGNIVVDSNFDVGQIFASAKVDNYGCIQVGGNFSITHANSKFYTETMVTVGENWVNYGTVSGSATSCGGFKVAGGTVNYGTYGTVGNIDMCDMGHPPLGFDWNAGTIGANVTNCVCQNYCAPLGIKNSEQNINKIGFYPNPSIDELFVKSTTSFETAEYQIIDVLGKTVREGKLYNKTIPVSNIKAGVYVIHLFIDKEGVAVAQRFVKQ